jgi:hypothetical protein
MVCWRYFKASRMVCCRFLDIQIELCFGYFSFFCLKIVLATLRNGSFFQSSGHPANLDKFFTG